MPAETVSPNTKSCVNQASPLMQRRRVVVTGIGMINPMGHDPATVWEGLKQGDSGVAYTTLFDASGFPTKISAEVKQWDLPPGDVVGNRSVESLGRHTKFAIG